MWDGVSRSGHAMEGRALVERKGWKRWRPEGRTIAWKCWLISMESLRHFCLSWGVLWSPPVESLPPRPCLSFQVGRFFYLHFTRSVGLAACTLQEQNVSCGKQKLHAETHVWFLNSKSLCSYKRIGLMNFSLFHLLSFKGKDSNCAIQDYVKYLSCCLVQQRRSGGVRRWKGRENNTCSIKNAGAD